MFILFLLSLCLQNINSVYTVMLAVCLQNIDSIYTTLFRVFVHNICSYFYVCINPFVTSGIYMSHLQRVFSSPLG